MPSSIVTDRLVLRGPTIDDADSLWPSVSDPEVPYHMTWEAHRDIEETRAFLRFCQTSNESGTAATWVVHEQGGAFVGLVGVDTIVRHVRAWRKDVGELGYWIAPAMQGRGYASEASRAVLVHAFTELALHKVAVGCIAENVRSKRTIERLGFRFVGAQRDHAFRHGRWWDYLAYEMTEPEWRAAHAR